MHEESDGLDEVWKKDRGEKNVRITAVREDKVNGL